MVNPEPAYEANPNGTGLARVRRLWSLFRDEKANPESFYRALAAEALVDLNRRHGLEGARVLDLGCGPGYYSRAFGDAGARIVGLDGDLEALTSATEAVPGGLKGDAASLPFPDSSFDGVFCSNLLEHASDTEGVFEEIARVLKPSGWGYVSWTNWYSPWGGHDMTPFQFLGPDVGPKLYERLKGPPRKNRFGEGLFAVHIGQTLRLARSIQSIQIDSVEPRYWPKLKFITSVPIIREVFTWNCVIRFSRA